jgi:hypothetical protein
MRKMRNLLLLGLMIFSIDISFAQQFSFQGELSFVDSTAFFQINLPPFVYNHLNRNRSDLRILDDRQKEVPFIWKDDIGQGRDSLSYLRVKGVKFSQREEMETRRSIVSVTLPALERINLIEIKACGQKYFRRFGQLSFINYDHFHKKRRKHRMERIDVELSSEDTLVLKIDEAKVKKLNLQIENEDNPPLKITDITIKQYQHQVIAYLERWKKYTIAFGNADQPSPNYDLEYFRSKVPKDLRNASIKNISKKQTIRKEKAFYSTLGFIWTAIIIVAGVLGFASFRMVKELGRKASG